MSRATVSKEAQLGELVPIPLTPPLMRTLSLVYPKERMHSRTVSAFMALARERLAAVGSLPETA
jgi:DNA-binding transcriptional LysR family regulator